MSADEELVKAIREWKDSQLNSLEWRQRYFKLIDETDALKIENDNLRQQLARPASEEIANLRNQVSALNMKCTALMEALDSAKLGRKSSFTFN